VRAAGLIGVGSKERSSAGEAGSGGNTCSDYNDARLALHLHHARPVTHKAKQSQSTPMKPADQTHTWYASRRQRRPNSHPPTPRQRSAEHQPLASGPDDAECRRGDGGGRRRPRGGCSCGCGGCGGLGGEGLAGEHHAVGGNGVCCFLGGGRGFDWGLCCGVVVCD